MIVRIFLLATALATIGCASTEHRSQRIDAFAALPDWTGIWEADAWSGKTVAGAPAGGIAQVRAKSQLSRHPPYNAEWEAKYQSDLKNEALRAAAATTITCSFGFPRVMESPPAFKIVSTPEETLFVFETLDVRSIYTDGRQHPPQDELWPTRMGDSIGRWEGATLVVDTIGRLSTASVSLAAFAAKLSDQARVTERIRRVSEDELENRMTIDDPVAFKHPWQFTLKYRRVAELDRITNYDCNQNDRNPVVDGKVTIAPPR